MRRKIIKQGHNTLTVSLPRKWCDNHHLKEGEEIELSEKGSCLVLSKEAFQGTGHISVDISGINRSTIILLIQSLYTYGYDSITLTTKHSKATYHMTGKQISIPSIINDSVNRLLGAEIVSSSSSKFRIEVLTEDSRKKFDTVLRRIFRLIIEVFDDFVKGIRKKDRTIINSIEFQYINVKKFTNYALRLINKFGHEEADKTSFYFAVVCFLSKIIEIIKNFAGYTICEGKLNLSKKCCDMVDNICHSFKAYYGTFYKYDIKQIGELQRNRDLFKQKLYVEKHKRLSVDDVFVLTGLTQIYDVMLDLSEARMAIGYQSFK